MDLAISRKKKEALVETYRQILKENTSLIMTDYSGLTVKEMETLRARIREIGGEFHVVGVGLAVVIRSRSLLRTLRRPARARASARWPDSNRSDL